VHPARRAGAAGLALLLATAQATGHALRLATATDAARATPVPGVARGVRATPAARCADAAGAFVASLPQAAREHAAWPFAAELRSQWSYRSGSQFRRQGVRAGELDDAQRRRAQALLGCALSSQGYLKSTGVMQLDDLVRERAGAILMNDGRQPVELGQEWFWFTVFGRPGGADPWGLQVEGHHLALNVTVVGREVAVTPAFWGAWPASVETGPMAGLRVLSREEDGAFALLALLTPAQRARAVVSDTLPAGIFTSPERNASLARYEGVPASALAPAARAALLALVAEYVGNFDEAIAGPWLARIEADGLERLHFAWMGATTPGSAVYYRIHGPSILIEFDHAPDITKRGMPPDPNHVHTIVRRPGGDLGEDLLARHYRESARHRLAGAR
jgi:hypothetical protein